MPQPARYTLDTTPRQIDVAPDATPEERSVLVIAQADGTIVICRDVASYATGARIPVNAGDTITVPLKKNEDLWLAAPAALAVDVVETGVAP